MNLTPHFTLEEFTASAKATKLKLDNTPPPELIHRIIRTAEMLERIREKLGVPINITSGYRCATLNRAVGGVANSDHTQGWAADIVAPAYGPPFKIALALAPLVDALGIGQLILEGVKGKQWVHVSTHAPPNPVNRVITITDAGAQVGVKELA